MWFHLPTKSLWRNIIFFFWNGLFSFRSEVLKPIKLLRKNRSCLLCLTVPWMIRSSLRLKGEERRTSFVLEPLAIRVGEDPRPQDHVLDLHLLLLHWATASWSLIFPMLMILLLEEESRGVRLLLKRLKFEGVADGR